MDKLLTVPSEEASKILKAFGIDTSKCAKAIIRFEMGEPVIVEVETLVKVPDEDEIVQVLKKYKLTEIAE